MAEQGVAGGGIPAEKNEQQRNREPGETRRQSRVARDASKKAVRRLPGRDPPGQNRGHRRNQDEGKELARNPAFDLVLGLTRPARIAPDKIVPGQDTQDDRRPAVEGGLLV